MNKALVWRRWFHYSPVSKKDDLAARLGIKTPSQRMAAMRAAENTASENKKAPHTAKPRKIDPTRNPTFTKPPAKPLTNSLTKPATKDSKKSKEAYQIAHEFAESQKVSKKVTKKPNFQTKKPLPKTKIAVPTFCSVANLGNILRVRINQLLEKLSDLGVSHASYDYILDAETAALVADEFGFEVSMNDETGADLFPALEKTDDAKLLKPRAPIVTIMGHVDHGKTTILDFLRKSSIAAKEHGGITQHIGAFSVKTPRSGKIITFLDTPGHAAFLKMRERGANMTDIVVLVVAADDSVMPQTKEAIRHAKAAGVQVIVAINKCDLPGANPERVVGDLATAGIDVEDYGGDTQVVRVSGKTGLGMEELEESIVALSEIQDLKSPDSKVPIEGWIIESEVKKGLGNVATFLVKRGTLKPGLLLVCGTTVCKVRAMRNEMGKSVKSAAPSMPVEVTGWRELPEAGDFAIQAKSESFAKKVISNRIHRESVLKGTQLVDSMNEARLKTQREALKQEKREELAKLGLVLEDIGSLDTDEFDVLLEDSDSQTVCKEVPYIIKADVSGSAEAVKESIANLGNDEVHAKVLYADVGTVNDTDLERAETAKGTILTFNINVPKDALLKGEARGIPIKQHNVIYHLIEEVVEDLTSRLAPVFELKVVAAAEIRAVFSITGKNKKLFKIAGCKVVSGSLKRNSKIRVMRNDLEVFRGSLNQLKHEKDEVNEVRKGSDCGVAFTNWQNFEEGDTVEVYEEIQLKRFL